MHKKKVLVLGSTGMLGYGVTKTLQDDNLQVITTSRKKNDRNHFDAINTNLNHLPRVDYILNCIGIIKPYMKNIINAVEINSAFPHKLANYCKQNDTKLIHITTDCVYSGKKGMYVETDLHDALDDYGKSKSLGECSDSAMVLRTSIVGEEKEHFVSLVSWVKSMSGKEVSGYTNHLWNGITTNYYGKMCKKIILEDLHSNGCYHIFSSEDVTKSDMLKMFNKKWNLKLSIEDVEANESVDRTLRSVKELNSILNVPSIESMINEI